MLYPFYIWLTKIWKSSLRLKYCIVISLSFIVIGYPFTLIHTYFGVYFTVSDYGAFFILGIFLNLFKYFNFQTALIFIFTSSLFFENLGFVYLISLFFLRRDFFSTTKHNILLISSAIAAPISLLFVVNFLAPDEFFYLGFANIYFYDNLHQFGQILGAFSLIFLKISFLAFITSKIKKLDFKKLHEASIEVRILLFTFLVTYLIGFFNSGISHEGARQTIVGQILFYFYLLDRYKSKQKDFFRSKIV
jgi:hypothetical protein